MKVITLAIIGLMVFGTISCHAKKVKGNGVIITKEIQVSDYKEIKVGQGIESGGMSFTKKNNPPRFNYAQQSGSASLEITIDENLLPLLTIKSDGTVLQIEPERGTQISPTRLEMSGRSRELRKLEVSGGMDFFLQSKLTGNYLDVKASGASDVYLEKPVRISNLCKIDLSGASDLNASDLECDKIECNSSGASDIKLTGKANDGQYNCSGSSDIKSYDFVVKRLNCQASGSSDIMTNVTEKLEASASGSSDIKYKGNPKVNKNASGASDIENVD